MSQREQILKAVSKNKPTSSPLPEMKLFDGQCNNLIEKFSEMLKKIGGKTHILQEREDLKGIIASYFPNLGVLTSNMAEVDFGNLDLKTVSDPHLLENVEIAIIQGVFGVAENGAVWIESRNLVHNALPFITQQLVLVINQQDVVENMHVAYARIQLERPGYGVFIAGPSKTADIEQSLVIGAHGSRSLLVIIKP